MGKILTFFILIFALLAFASCGGNGDDGGDYYPEKDETYSEVQEPEVVEEPEEDSSDEPGIPEPISLYVELWAGPVRGAWNGNIWTNECLGLFFYLPVGWEYASDEEFTDLLGFDSALAAYGIGFAVGEGVLYDMWSLDLETGSSVSVFVEKMPDLGFGAEEFIEYSAGVFRQFEIYVDTHTEPKQIGGFEWVGFEFYSVDAGHFIAHFVRAIDGFAVVVLVQTSDRYDAYDLLGLFGYAGDAPEPTWEPFGSIIRGLMSGELRLPELEQPDADHPLVGSWAWDLYSGFVYNFDADGTGTRGFTGEIESFTWESMDDHLLIRLWNADESWTFFINGDLLTIDSRQVPGVMWRYVRQ